MAPLAKKVPDPCSNPTVILILNPNAKCLIFSNSKANLDVIQTNAIFAEPWRYGLNI